MSQKSAVLHLALVTAPTPSPAICSSFGISSGCWRCQNLVCSSCADVPQPSQVLVLLGGCVRDVQGAVLADSSLPGAEAGLEWWLQSALSREAWSCFVLFKWVQVNVIILEISEWWLVEQGYSSSGTQAGQISSMEGKMSCWEKELRLTWPQCSVVALPANYQSFLLPLQHCLMACDLPTPLSAQEVAECKEKTPNLPIILRVQDNPNSHLSTSDTE